jgi:hypothetical protein
MFRRRATPTRPTLFSRFHYVRNHSILWLKPGNAARWGLGSPTWRSTPALTCGLTDAVDHGAADLVGLKVLLPVARSASCGTAVGIEEAREPNALRFGRYSKHLAVPVKTESAVV